MKIVKSEIEGNIKLEIEVRRIKNIDEMKNVLRKNEKENYKPEDFVVLSKTVNPDTFQPEIIVGLKDSEGTLNRGLFYLWNLEVVHDAGGINLWVV